MIPHKLVEKTKHQLGHSKAVNARYKKAQVMSGSKNESEERH